MKNCVECGGNERVALVYPNKQGVREALCGGCQAARSVVVTTAQHAAVEAYYNPAGQIPNPTYLNPLQLAHYDRAFNSTYEQCREQDELAQEEALVCGDLA